MIKKRTGLQSEISSIFSGVPIPKDRSEAKPRSPVPKRQGSAPSRPPVPQPPVQRPQIPDAPTPRQNVEQIKKAPSPKVRELALSDKEIKSIPRAVSRRKNKLYSFKLGAISAKQKAEAILSIVLLIVLVVVLTRPFRAAVNDSEDSGLDGQETFRFLGKADVEIDWPVPTVYRTDLRDPMTLASDGQIYIETLRPVVRGIVYSEDRPFAIVGIEMMGEGEVAQGATIVKINPDSVVFEKDGKQWTQGVEGQDL